jgi:hypothetical protein
MATLIVVTLLAGYIPARMIVKQNTLDAILGRNSTKTQKQNIFKRLLSKISFFSSNKK